MQYLLHDIWLRDSKINEREVKIDNDDGDYDKRREFKEYDDKKVKK